MSLKNQLHLVARGAMVYWLERSLVKQEDLSSIPAKTKWFFLSTFIKTKNKKTAFVLTVNHASINSFPHNIKLCR